MKPSQLKIAAEVAFRNRRPILVKGAPGIGKTDIIYQAAEAAGCEVHVSHPVVSDPTDYKGMPFVVDGKATFLPFGDLQKLIDADKPLVFFMDDLGQAPASVQAAAMQLILARKINGHRVSDNVTFAAATNRKSDKAGVSGILEPVKSRFVSIWELVADLDDWIKWALNNNLPMELLSFIRFRPNLLCDFSPTADFVNSPCPRTVANVAKCMQDGYPPELEYEVYSGAAGEGFAAELMGFLKIYRDLPNPDVIIMNPDKAEVPEDPATLYALAGALTAKAGENNFERICTYGERMPAEFNVMMVRDIISKNQELTGTRAFINWSVNNSDVIM